MTEPTTTEQGAPAPAGPLHLARMSGLSIAGRDAAPWVTDFLNAGYFRRGDDAPVDDLRLAFAILTTSWYRSGGRRLRVTDLPAFHRAFGGNRFSTARTARGTLDRETLLEGADRLLGDWFSGAYGDDERRGWGVVFPTPEERAAYDHGRRLALAKLGPLTPGSAPAAEQTWHTYPPVAMPSAAAVVDAVTRPETWPDFASEIGRFTPLRPGGLAGQTFEIDVAAGTRAGRPVFTRGYVTITALVTPEDPEALAAWFAALEEGLARHGDGEPRAVPEGATPLVGFDLTTHQGHFMGNGRNRLVLFEQDGTAYLRTAGTWDPMPWHLAKAYQAAGEEAQHAFWGQGADPRQSMLHQIAERLAA